MDIELAIVVGVLVVVVIIKCTCSSGTGSMAEHRERLGTPRRPDNTPIMKDGTKDQSKSMTNKNVSEPVLTLVETLNDNLKAFKVTVTTENKFFSDAVIDVYFKYNNNIVLQVELYNTYSVVVRDFNKLMLESAEWYSNTHCKVNIPNIKLTINEEDLIKDTLISLVKHQVEKVESAKRKDMLNKLTGG